MNETTWAGRGAFLQFIATASAHPQRRGVFEAWMETRNYLGRISSVFANASKQGHCAGDTLA